MKQVILVNSKDNVVTAVSEILENTTISVNDQTITVKQSISFGHKIAIDDIKKGEDIIKYGESVGMAKEDIAQGGWVHTHNVEETYRPPE
ncbi:UxaA family hydrolase [Candidatus Borrarchaeum sp.]|uniref:UxaA family hydrolase n=1 Tax=Candidatus Borrarchaeum sp. TaxID=2846742 RepID=UPI00257F05C8|nr:UxaA family hydrolase [Candidatus Borrarchaeum sp.]